MTCGEVINQCGVKGDKAEKRELVKVENLIIFQPNLFGLRNSLCLATQTRRLREELGYKNEKSINLYLGKESSVFLCGGCAFDSSNAGYDGTASD